MRTIDAASACNGSDDHWLQTSRDGIARKRLDVATVEKAIREGPSASSLTSFERIDGRRLGRPSSTFRIGRLVADRFLARMRSGWGPQQDVLVLRRETVEARADHLEERSSPSGIAVTRHALERLYEREQCCHAEIHARLLDDLAEADRTLAFAVASGLFVRGGPRACDAYTVLPLGSGLLVVRNVVVAMQAGRSPITRYVVGRRGVSSLPVATDPHRRVDLDHMDGMAVDGHLLALGITYLSSDILFLEQHAYAALFHREAARFDLAAIAADDGRTWLPHEKRPAPMAIEADPRLHYLLSQIVGAKPPGMPCLSIGWNGRDDPRPEASRCE